MKYRLGYTRHRKPTSGFTLIELLVVISIIALLLSILLPSMRAAREQAKQMVCSSQMRQVGLAQLLYINDFDKYTPMFQQFLRPEGWRYRWWFQHIFNYSETLDLTRCPSVKWSVAGGNRMALTELDDPLGKLQSASEDGWIHLDYILNGYLGCKPDKTIWHTEEGMPASKVSNPSSRFMVWDAWTGIRDTRDFMDNSGFRQGPPPEQYDRMRCPIGWEPLIPAPQHGKGHNYLYADGHVSWHNYVNVPWDDRRFYAK